MYETYFEDIKLYTISFVNEFKRREYSEHCGFGIRALKNKKLGFSYCSEKIEVPDAKKRAEETSRFSPESNFSFQDKTKKAKLDIFDKKIENIDITQLKEIVDQIKDTIKGVDTKRIEISCSNEYVLIENDLGLKTDYSRTSFAAYVEAIKGNGLGFDLYSSNFLPDKEISEIGENAANLAKQMEQASKVETGKYLVVIEQETLANLLEVFLPSFSGEWKRKKISNLYDSYGKKVFDEKLSIYDNPTKTVGAVPVDDEGTTLRKRGLIEDGIVKDFMYDREVAALEGVDNEGFCSRSNYSEPPEISNFAIEIKEGNVRSLDELGNHICVKSVHGTHTANLTTGDFGVEISAGFEVKNGEKKPIRGVMMSGNIFDLFRKIEGIEKTRKEFYNLLAPRIAISGVDIIS